MEDVTKLINEIKHPEINNTLSELSMIGDIKVDGKRVNVEVKLPMLEVPIRQLFVDLIKQKLNAYQVEVEFSAMNDTEREKFFKLSKENWAL
ncbi:hypothetical protein DRJ25_03760 [Candidatus Woesearchaeota archaeon]|nr:MAG: hypothetical protein DRJ25_03760 [Candidatus Woesearchaeota archaeon]